MTKTARLFSLLMAGCQSLSKARFTRIILLLAFFASLGAAGSYGLFRLGTWGYEVASSAVAHNLNVKIKNVTIAGADNFDVNETLERGGLSIGAFVTDVDWSKIKNDLMRNPMIEKARIVRRSPEDVHVMISLRQPIARIDNKEASETILVDRKGNKVRVSGESNDKNLIMISGKEAFSDLDSFWPVLMAEPNIAEQIAAARYVGMRRWDIIMKSGTTVQLPQNDTGLAMRNLAQMLESQKLDPASVRTIDLRAGDRMYLRINQAENIKEGSHVAAQNQG